MELKDFITETLVQMMEGVKNAQERSKVFGAIVNPVIVGNYSKDVYLEGDNYAKSQDVEFEIALTEISNSDKQKGIGVAFAGIGFKGGSDKSEQSHSSNTIKFKIPVVLPYTNPYKKSL